MTLFLFLLAWTGIFFVIGLSLFRVIRAHIKVYLLIILNCIYLAGIFIIYPIIFQIS